MDTSTGNAAAMGSAGPVLVHVQESDALALCLSAFVQLTHRATSLQSLVAGLPTQDGRLTAVLMQRALERLGYKTRLDRRALGQLHSINLPAILFMAEEDAVIALERTRSGMRILDPQTGSEVVMAMKELAEAYSGTCLLARKSAASMIETVSEADKPAGHWFWSAVTKLSRTYMYVIVGASLINILALASPLFTMNVYDRVLPNKNLPTLWVLASGMVLALAFDYLLKLLRSRLIEHAGRRADVLLSSRIFSHVMSIKLNQRPATTGSFASHLKEFENVREFFTSNTIASFTDMAFFIFFVAIIAMVGGPIAFIPAVAAVILITAGLFYQIPLRRAANKHSAETAQRHSVLVETIAALETVKLLRAEGHLQAIWEGLTGVTSKTVERVRQLNSSLANFSSFVQQLVAVLIVVVGAYMFKDGLISMGAIVACVMLGSKAVAPLGQFAMVLARSQQSLASLAALNKIMAMESESQVARNFVSKPIDDTTLQFQNVHFAYPGSPNPVLAQFNLQIRPGEKVGIIGKIGSGKTTIGRLMTKLYEPSEGAVMIGGVDMRQYHPHEVRRVVGLLNQDTDLFHGTLRSNILMAAPRATDEQVIRAARLAGVDDFVRRHPAGYDMQVGERGQALSGGQRQSVALARLLIGEPQVLFLDEPSSAMDLASERLLIEQLKGAVTRNQTVIVSTHRYSMLELVDRLIVLNNGKVAADGPKDAVLNALRKQSQQGQPPVQQQARPQA
jgi:ATP-binding cassette, subfamily C, bacterial LapB